MSTRNLARIFSPRSVAVIGATPRKGSVGSVLVSNLVRGGLDAPVYAVNPKRNHVLALPAYPDVNSLPKPPDLAVIATPPPTVPGLVAELGARGTRAAIVISAGFGEGGSAEGHDLRQAMLQAARPHLLRIVGPNCLGVMAPHAGLNATFAHAAPEPGRIAFVTQSGAVATAVVDWAAEKGVGFSHVVSLGDMSDVDFGDMLDYLATDRLSRAILLYVEAVTDARKFMSAARAASRAKPVIVIKAGRFPEGARAAASHTGALAGADDVYDAAFRRAGLLRVTSLDELFNAAETLGKVDVPKGNALAILTNGGGAGVLATDALIEAGGRLAELSPACRDALDAVLPKTWSKANPVDMIGDADAARYRDSLDILLRDPNVDAVLVLNCPTAITPGTEAAEAVVEVAARTRSKPVFTSWLGGAAALESRHLFAARGLPTYETPNDAVVAFAHLDRYRQGQVNLSETPPSVPEDFSPDPATVRSILDAVLAENRGMLTEAEAKQVLAAYGVPTTRQAVAASPEEVSSAAAGIPAPWALKILSRDISHKSDVGGVVLGLRDDQALREAARSMAARIGRERPEARLDGYLVQEMVAMDDAYELIVGMKEDAQFGPAILFGQGGTAVELVGDTSLGLPPLNMRLAREMISSTRIYRLLKGFRGTGPVDMDAVALSLLKVAQLTADFGEIKELDINPLLAGPDGVVALDARIGIAPYSGHPHQRLAIKPYPKELEEVVELPDGRTLMIRPIQGEDEPELREAFDRLSPEEVRLRFFVPIKTLGHAMASRLSQINYDREMALVLADPGRPGTSDIHAVARLSADPDNETAEYALIVWHGMTGMGLGTLMMRRLLGYARSRGIREVFGDVLKENERMLALCARLGFQIEEVADDPGLMRTWMALDGKGRETPPPAPLAPLVSPAAPAP